MFSVHKLLLLVAMAGFLNGCSQPDSTTALNTVDNQESLRVVTKENPIQVTATVGMVADLVRSVGGERVSVTQICGSGVDPHLYKVTRDDVQLVRKADIVFYSGLMLEGKMSDTLVKEARSRPVIAVTEAIEESLLLEPEDFAGHFDPHVWMDVSVWSKCVDVIVAELTSFDPAGNEFYKSNAAAYQEELKKLHEYGQRAIASIPEGSRVLVTSHDAFNYFGRAYGLEVLGVQGISTESEAGLRRINDMVNLLVDRKIRSVFIESSVSSDNIEALVEGAKSKGSIVAIGDKELFSDAMGESGTYEGTYIGMLDHNITQVTRGLGGNAPPGGLNGKLKQ
jgi:manganese/zinc/iron transport system substrate-binding protein